MRELTSIEQLSINGGVGSPGLMGHIVAVGETFWSFAGSFIDGFIEGSEAVIEANN